MEASIKAATTAHLEILRNLTDETLEGQLANQQLRRLLVAPDFTQSDGTRPETMRLLHSTGRGLCEREEGVSVV